MTVQRSLPQDIASFAELIAPVTEETFYEQFFERHWLHVRAIAGQRRETVLTIEGMNTILSSIAFRADECKVARGGEIIRAASYILPPGERVMGRSVTDQVNTTALLDWFAQGATLVFSQLNQKWQPLQRLKDALERTMSAAVVMNVFLSNQHSQGFSLHYDSHDVFVVQLHGAKTWSLYDSPIELPTKREAFGTLNVSPHGAPTVAKLEEGDLLYVPRGIFHEARTAESASLHLTIGVHPYLWIDHLRDVIDQVGSMATKLRRSVPRGDEAGGTRVEQLRQILQELAELDGLEAIAGAAYRTATREKAQRGAVIQPDHLRGILDSSRLTEFSTVTCHADWRAVNLVKEGDQVVLRGPTRSTTVPGRWEAMLLGLRPAAKFRIGELPGQDPTEKLALAHRLVALGLLSAT
jgi:Cupin superfamily protein